MIPLLGVWEKAEDIDFDALPEKFVLKANHGCGYNIIVTDKSKIDIRKTRKQLNDWLKINYAFQNGFELHYKNIKPLIIAEQYLESADDSLIDYRFFCTNGEPKFCRVNVGPSTDRRGNVYDLDWNLKPWIFGHKNTDAPVVKPNSFEEMIELAHILCQGFIHVRVDFYSVLDKIYFGEMTFTPGSGMTKIDPKEYAVKLGDMIKLPI